MAKCTVLILFIAMIITAAQLFLKKHLLALPLPTETNMGTFWAWFRSSLGSPIFLAIPICCGASSLLWVWVMNRTDMTTAYAMVSVVYVFMFAAGYFFLGETMTWLKALGAALIISGIICVTR